MITLNKIVLAAAALLVASSPALAQKPCVWHT